MINLKIELQERSYPVFIGNNILEKFGEMFELYGLGPQAVVITDSNVWKLYGKTLTESFRDDRLRERFIICAPGEKSKSLQTVENIITKMLELNCDRETCVLAFGGGVIGDLAGFVAAIFKRGLPLVQVPTTLLAQVDSSIGGKTGVNHALGKNLVGAFYQPKVVWSDLTLLHSLPRRELLCGLGEIIKYGVIKDGGLFSLVEENLERVFLLDHELLAKVVQRCCEIKAAVVTEDELDLGQRMILNFGHTIGHALETAVGYKKLVHGEAVLLGILVESRMALELGMLKDNDFERIRAFVKKLDLGKRIKGIEKRRLFQAIEMDKKKTGGRLRFVLPTSIGQVEILEVEDRFVQSAVDYLLEIT
ncbi:MAG: 3-dehydroquinate synthase [bacterium]